MRGSLAAHGGAAGDYAAAFVGAHRHAVVQLALVGRLDQSGLLRTRRIVARASCGRLHLLTCRRTLGPQDKGRRGAGSLVPRAKGIKGSSRSVSAVQQANALHTNTNM